MQTLQQATSHDTAIIPPQKNGTASKIYTNVQTCASESPPAAASSFESFLGMLPHFLAPVFVVLLHFLR